ncbi:MAG TPA: hypothetical protein DD381_09770 [Lentisphaeria bacterium]|nr:MAG: hypothetical protein A2X47_09720 [Lentisphaerae bacterium GWF2_38_69]HBM16612.1 hypothetical protein [Lentisphaeria bacterium]
MKKAITLVFAITAIAFLAGGCGTTNVDMNYKGVETTNGKAIALVNTTVCACHLFGVWPMFWDASYTNTFNEFIKESKRLNGNKIDIVTSSSNKNYIIGMFTLCIFTPVTTSIAGDVYY